MVVKQKLPAPAAKTVKTRDRGTQTVKVSSKLKEPTTSEKALGKRIRQDLSPQKNEMKFGGAQTPSKRTKTATPNDCQAMNGITVVR